MIKQWTATMILTGAVSISGALGTARASEKKVQFKDLPQPVQNAIQQEAKGAEIKGYAKEVEGGKTFYEAETMLNGHTRDLLFDAAGNLVEVEETVAVEALPAAVRARFDSQGKIVRAETVTKGKITTYEAQVEKNGKKFEVAVDANGNLIKKVK